MPSISPKYHQIYKNISFFSYFFPDYTLATEPTRTKTSSIHLNIPPSQPLQSRHLSIPKKISNFLYSLLFAPEFNAPEIDNTKLSFIYSPILAYLYEFLLLIAYQSLKNDINSLLIEDELLDREIKKLAFNLINLLSTIIMVFHISPLNSPFSKYTQAIKHAISSYLSEILFFNSFFMIINYLNPNNQYNTQTIEEKLSSLISFFTEYHYTPIPIALKHFNEITKFAIIPPIWEEFLFRAHFYRIIKSHTRPQYAAVISALIFTIIHRYHFTASLILFISSLRLVKAYETTGNILSPIIMHLIHNLWLIIYALAVSY